MNKPIRRGAPTPYPYFKRKRVSGEQIAAAARHYIGAPYCNGAAFESGGAANCDCVGLVLLVWRRLGLLGRDFDLSLPYATLKVSRASALMAMLRANYKPTKTPKIGDLIISKGNRHVAIIISDEGHIASSQENVGRTVERLIGVEDKPFTAWTLRARSRAKEKN